MAWRRPGDKPLSEPMMVSLLQPKFNTKRYGYRSFKYFGSKIWNSLPTSIKNLDDLDLFKRDLFNWCMTDHANKLLEQLEL